MSAASCKISIIIEWENVLRSELDRCRRMLRELCRQILELQSSPARSPEFNIRVAFDPGVVSAALISAELERVFPAENPALAWHLVPLAGRHYYELKNDAAQEADGDIILFLDSDVIPESGWLGTLLGAFDDPAVEVVGGHVFLDLSEFLGRAMALFWFFPLRATDAALREVPVFWANNIAFRRATANRFPFPGLAAGATRGSCVALSRQLQRAGIKIYTHSGAQLSHPPPSGWYRVLVRGVAAGRDELLLCRGDRDAMRGGGEGWRALRRLFSVVFHGGRRILKWRRDVQLAWYEIPGALLVLLLYSHGRLMGSWGTQLFPNFMGRHFRI